MDVRARHALEDLVRETVGRDLDVLAGEVAWLRQRVTALERVAGVPAAPRGQAERRERAAEMREQGCSTRVIAAVVGADRNTVTADLRLLGVEPPQGLVVGLDGRVTAPRLRPLSGADAAG